MKTFIFTFALIACLMLAMGAPVDETTDGPDAAEILSLGKAVTNQQCKAIGSLCSLSEECCSLRCATYRQRCAS